MASLSNHGYGGTPTQSCDVHLEGAKDGEVVAVSTAPSHRQRWPLRYVHDSVVIRTADGALICVLIVPWSPNVR